MPVIKNSRRGFMKLHIIAGLFAFSFLSGCNNSPADPDIESILASGHASSPLAEVSSIVGVKTLNGTRVDEVTYTADIEYQLVADISYSDFERIHEQEVERDSQGMNSHDKLRLQMEKFKEKARVLRKLGEVNPVSRQVTGFERGDTKLFSETLSFKYTEDDWKLVSQESST